MKTPVFHTREELLAKLSLDESGSDSTQAKVDQAFLEFHVLCLDVMGDGFKDDVKPNDPRGQIAEFKLVRAVLLDLLNFVEIGSSTIAQETWNEEGLAREAHDKKNMIATLKREARDLLSKICSTTQDTGINTSVLEEDISTYTDVFDSI